MQNPITILHLHNALGSQIKNYQPDLYWLQTLVAGSIVYNPKNRMGRQAATIEFPLL
jgi:hypothetical protein